MSTCHNHDEPAAADIADLDLTRTPENTDVRRNQQLSQDKLPPLVDRFGRVHRSLRVSVTDVCNIRCLYCMPGENVRFLPKDRLLSFEQIELFVRAATEVGIRKIRITGGEPLTRPNLHQLIRHLNAIDKVADIALTTNGMLLKEQVDALTQAGLKRVNISLDTLREETFQRLSRRDGIDRVIEGIDAAVDDQRLNVKLNALVLRDVNTDDILPLVDFANKRKIEMRFIEFMPLDADGAWSKETLVSGQQVRETIAAEFGELQPIKSPELSQPARSFLLPGGGKVGFIDSVSQPFCSACDRLRLTAEGKLQNCLFGRDEWDVSGALRRSDTTEDDLIAIMRSCVAAKHASHGISDEDFVPPERAMYQIGG